MERELMDQDDGGLLTGALLNRTWIYTCTFGWVKCNHNTD